MCCHVEQTICSKAQLSSPKRSFWDQMLRGCLAVDRCLMQKIHSSKWQAEQVINTLAQLHCPRTLAYHSLVYIAVNASSKAAQVQQHFLACLHDYAGAQPSSATCPCSLLRPDYRLGQPGPHLWGGWLLTQPSVQVCGLFAYICWGAPQPAHPAFGAIPQLNPCPALSRSSAYPPGSS